MLNVTLILDFLQEICVCAFVFLLMHIFYYMYQITVRPEGLVTTLHKMSMFLTRFWSAVRPVCIFTVIYQMKTKTQQH